MQIELLGNSNNSVVHSDKHRWASCDETYRTGPDIGMGLKRVKSGIVTDIGLKF